MYAPSDCVDSETDCCECPVEKTPSYYHSSRGVPLTEISSTSNIRVASPGIVGGAPFLP